MDVRQGTIGNWKFKSVDKRDGVKDYDETPRGKFELARKKFLASGKTPIKPRKTDWSK